MSEIERRALLGAVGIGAIAAMSKGGPLDPPAGAVSPSGRTLDEVYNRIPALPNGTADGRVQIPGGGGTSVVTISQPGSYVLTGNLDPGAAGINTLTITADNVTLDLNGYRIASANGGCIQISGARSNIVVRNGTLVGGQVSLITDSSSLRGLLLENLRVHGSKFVGISIVASASRDCVIRRCEVSDCGVSTVASDANAVVAGIAYNGSAGRIEECAVHNLANNSSTPIASRGILMNTAAATGNLVSRCHLGNAAGVTGVGLYMLGGVVYRDNTVSGYSTAYSGGTNGGGNM